MEPDPDLSLNAWAVLTLLVDDGPQHGFALARQLERSGEIGRVWSVPRPLVYRSLDQLNERGLAALGPTEPSPSGPARQTYLATPGGQTSVGVWRTTPVDHLRDVRSALMLKLTLSRRAGVDLRPLLAAQRERFAELTSDLARQGSEEAKGEAPAIVDIWRDEMARALDRTLDRVADLPQS